MSIFSNTEDAVMASLKKSNGYEIYEQSNFFKDQIELPELDRALNTLNRRYRYILFARAVEGRSFEEIGAELGLDYKGVAAIYYRARNKIRKEMGEKYEF